MSPKIHPFRCDFLIDPDVIFLNHGSFGATPIPVFESYQRWQRELEKQPVEFLGRRATDLLAQSRQVLASYLGTSRDNLVYVTNATVGLNTVARSLKLSTGDEVLSSDHEYGAMDRTWRFLSQMHGFKYINHAISLPVTTTNEFVDSFWQSVTPQTRLIFLSQITSPTAMIFPVEEICKRARSEGILTVIDGAHVPGQIDLSLDQLGADIYSGNLHKWLCAPKGSGFLFARPEVQHLIEPLIVSWGWDSENPGPSQFVDYQEWTGTRDISAFLAVPDAICYQEMHDWNRVRTYCHALASDARRRITAITGIEPFYPDDETWYAQMGTAPLPANVDINSLKTRLYDEFHIEIPVLKWNGKNLIRFSFQAYNTPEEVDALEIALKNLLAVY
ncbi:MAG: aminotransferase class V-fold PLP-dependent enzyme [Anaerolineaceae bacterium]|nr:aminotransferase class V-fold PLP-dependent enzyme [Anaerolineaceae bacterium]